LTTSLLGSAHAQASDDSAGAPSSVTRSATATPTPLDGLGPDLRDAFTGTNLLWYAEALAATGTMALGGADHAIRVSVQRNLYSPVLADGAFYAGYLLPAVIAPALYLTGLSTQNRDAAGAGSAVLQALGITVVATGLLKFAAGRPYPLNGGDPSATDRLDNPEYARVFHPFQTLWPLPSWPSGHTSATVSVAATLTAYYPNNIWVPIIGYSLALLIGFGMVDGDNHWASDVVAGALLGQAIGHSVGSAFRQRAQGVKDKMGARPTLAPVLSPSYCGVAGTFF
jgi:membrane-associated phospholipid phosphatase